MTLNRSGLFIVTLLMATLVLTATAGAATDTGVAGAAAAKQWDVPAYTALTVKATTGPVVTDTQFLEALQDNFSALDTNHDGFVSYAEALTALPGLTQDQFYTIDTNGDGKISSAEADAAGGCSGCACSQCDAKKRLGDLFLAGLSLSMLAVFTRRK